MSIWRDIEKNIKLNSEEIILADELYNEYMEKSYISRTPSYMAKLSDNVIIRFYSKLSEQKNTKSPVAEYKDSKWMTKSSFSFVNVRATGVGSEFGNFIQAAKLIPTIRSESIHLGPFTEYSFNVIYAVASLESISNDVVNHYLIDLGFNREEQLKAFVEAVHMLDKTVGFDLEPHTTQNSTTAFIYPELFRWFKLNEDKEIDYNISYYEMTRKEWQDRISSDIRSIVRKIMGKEGVNTIEYEKDDSYGDIEKKIGVYIKLTMALIENGYWMIPAQAWNCYGIPEYTGYNFHGNHPNFHYRCENGYDQYGNAMHVICNFKFYDNLGINTKHSENLILNEKAVDYFSNIFIKWRDEFDFDFIRHDSMDHIFDSADGDYIPQSDRVTPIILKKCIERSRKSKPYIGNLAERMGMEFEEYNRIGYDLTLGHDMFIDIDEKSLRESFDFYHRVKRYNQDDLKATACYAVDTHDTGNPALMGASLIERFGYDKMIRRLFLARFMAVGSGRRVKYEVMGLGDMSYGLFPANVNKRNIVWKDNEEFSKNYHWIEDIYEKFNSILENGEIIDNYIEKSYVYWKIKNSEKELMALITLGKSEKNVGIKMKKSSEKICKYSFKEKEEIHIENDKVIRLINKGENGVFVFELK